MYIKKYSTPKIGRGSVAPLVDRARRQCVPGGKLALGPATAMHAGVEPSVGRRRRRLCCFIARNFCVRPTNDEDAAACTIATLPAQQQQQQQQRRRRRRRRTRRCPSVDAIDAQRCRCVCSVVGPRVLLTIVARSPPAPGAGAGTDSDTSSMTGCFAPTVLRLARFYPPTHVDTAGFRWVLLMLQH